VLDNDDTTLTQPFWLDVEDLQCGWSEVHPLRERPQGWEAEDVTRQSEAFRGRLQVRDHGGDYSDPVPTGAIDAMRRLAQRERRPRTSNKNALLAEVVASYRKALDGPQSQSSPASSGGKGPRLPIVVRWQTARGGAQERRPRSGSRRARRGTFCSTPAVTHRASIARAPTCVDVRRRALTSFEQGISCVAVCRRVPKTEPTSFPS
jgi:hypothetical protein